MWHSFVREKVWFGVWPGTSTVIAVQTPICTKELCIEFPLRIMFAFTLMLCYMFRLSSMLTWDYWQEDSADNWMERSRIHWNECRAFVAIGQDWLERIRHFRFEWYLKFIHVFTVCAIGCICISVYVSYAVGILYQTSHWVRIFHYEVEEGTERISLRS